MMEPTFIYYNNLIFDDEKKFSIDYSDEDLLKVIVFKKNKDYYVSSMACYVDLTVDITKLANYAKIKQTTNPANAILRGLRALILDTVEKKWCLEKLVNLILYFDLTNLEEINTLKTKNFLMLKIKTQKTYIFIQHTKS